MCWEQAQGFETRLWPFPETFFVILFPSIRYRRVACLPAGDQTSPFFFFVLIVSKALSGKILYPVVRHVLTPLLQSKCVTARLMCTCMYLILIARSSGTEI